MPSNGRFVGISTLNYRIRSFCHDPSCGIRCPGSQERTQSKLETIARKEQQRLGTAEEVPEHQRRPHIKGYYRLESPRPKHFWSLHNEIGNIWTHLAALAYMVVYFADWLSEQHPPWQVESPRRFYLCGVAAYFFASIVVFATSVVFHWRACTSEREFLCWRCLDFSACLGLVVVAVAFQWPFTATLVCSVCTSA